MATIGLRIHPNTSGTGELLAKALTMFNDTTQAMEIARGRADIEYLQERQKTEANQRAAYDAQAAYDRSRTSTEDFQRNLRQENLPALQDFYGGLVEPPVAVELEPELAAPARKVTTSTFGPADQPQNFLLGPAPSEAPEIVDNDPLIFDTPLGVPAEAQATYDRERAARRAQAGLVVAGGGNAEQVAAGLGRGEGNILLGSADPATQRRAMVQLGISPTDETLLGTHDTAGTDAKIRLAEATEQAKGGPDNFGPIVSGQPAADLGLDPSRSYQQNAKTQKWDVISEIKPPPEGYRPPTDEERRIYGIPADMPVRVNKETGKPEAIGSQMPLVSPETGAKIGLIDDFLGNFNSIREVAASGGMTGLWDYGRTIAGRDAGGRAYRELLGDTEGIIRILTGAGMSESEAGKNAYLYEPQLWDDAKTMVSKLDGLRDKVLAAREAAIAGRNFPPAPGSTAAPSPAAGAADVDAILKKHGVP